MQEDFGETCKVPLSGSCAPPTLDEAGFEEKWTLFEGPFASEATICKRLTSQKGGEKKETKTKKQHWMVQNLGFRFHVSLLLSFLLLCPVSGPPRCCYSRQTCQLQAPTRLSHGFLSLSTRESGQRNQNLPVAPESSPEKPRMGTPPCGMCLKI